MAMTVRANGVDLGVEQFGKDSNPLILLIGGTTMLSWPDALCEHLASGSRRVVRYDLRDSGASTTRDPESPDYSLRDLAADASALVAALGHTTAQIAGIGVGGMVAQVAAIEHPRVVNALTVIGSRPVAPGPVDDDLPDHDRDVMEAMFSHPEPNWADRNAVAEAAAGQALFLANDPEQARATAAAIWDRTPGNDPAVHRANQSGAVFARLDCTPRWRERLPEVAVPTLIVHGRLDPFFPVGNGEAIAAAVPGADLVVVEDMGTALPDRATATIAEAMLAL